MAMLYPLAMFYQVTMLYPVAMFYQVAMLYPVVMFYPVAMLYNAIAVHVFETRLINCQGFAPIGSNLKLRHRLQRLDGK